MVRAWSLLAILFLVGLTGCARPYRPMQPFTSPEGNFACAFPGGSPSWRMKGWSFPPIHVAEGTNPGFEYAAGYGDCPYAPRFSDLPKIYSDMKDKVVADFSAKLLYSGDITIDGFRGTEFVLQLPPSDGRVCKMRAMIAGKRAYMFGVVALREDLNHADVHRFFSSFQLIEKPAATPEPARLVRK